MWTQKNSRRYMWDYKHWNSHKYSRPRPKVPGYPQARPGHLQTDQGGLPRLKRNAMPFQSLCFTQRPVMDQTFRNWQQIIPTSQARAIWKNERLSAEIKRQPHYLSQIFWSLGPSKMQSFSNNRCTFLPPSTKFKVLSIIKIPIRNTCVRFLTLGMSGDGGFV